MISKNEIISDLEKGLSIQKKDVSDYINKYFTKEEAEMHGNNIMSLLTPSDFPILIFKLKMNLKNENEETD